MSQPDVVVVSDPVFEVNVTGDTIEVVVAAAVAMGTGGTASVFAWAQAASTSWPIEHNLGHHPAAVTVVDDDGNVLTLFDRTDPDLNHTTLTFTTPVGGVAYLI